MKCMQNLQFKIFKDETFLISWKCETRRSVAKSKMDIFFSHKEIMTVSIFEFLIHHQRGLQWMMLSM